MVLGPVMADVGGLELDETDREFLMHPSIGGVILFDRNFEDRGQLTALVAEIKALRTPSLIVAVDHEGGRVQRFRRGFTELPAVSSYGKLFATEPDLALDLSMHHGWLTGVELTACGVDLSFAPVLDLRSKVSSVIGDRAFHEEPDVIMALAQACIDGMAKAGMEAVGKHYPGHGSVGGDSHFELPVDDRTLSELEARDLSVFAGLFAKGLPGVMMAHVAYPQIDVQPAGFSRIWIKDILRGRQGFAGTVFSDDLCMAGAHGAGSAGERAQFAFDVGCDVLLVCNDRTAAAETVDQLQVTARRDDISSLESFRAKNIAPSWDALEASSDWREARTALERLTG